MARFLSQTTCLFEDILSGPKLRDARTGGRFRRNAIEAAASVLLLLRAAGWR
jgi:hypothetical protein